MILLTGGTGYIGSNTAVKLIEEGYEVCILDNLTNSKIDILNDIQTITGIKPLFYEGDIRDQVFLESIFKTHSIDAVIHMAGLKSVKESVETPLLYYDNNVTGSITLIKVMMKFNCKKIIFSSSATVYGIDNKAPFTEDMPTKPINPYGESKLIIENILKDTQKATPDFSVGILRYFNPIGHHVSGLLKENPLNEPNNIMPLIIQVAEGKRSHIEIFGNDYNTPDGTCIRDYINVCELAEAHLKVLDYIKNINTFDIFNIGSGTGLSVLELINQYEATHNVKIPYVIGQRRLGDVDVSFSSITRFANLWN